MITFIAGTFIGAVIGFVMMALCIASKDGYQDFRREEQDEK